jgi:hypothetical protein
MTLSDFEQLTQAEQAKVLRESGSFLLVREGFRYAVSLYALGDFFAEVWVNKEKGAVIEVKGFREPWRLDAYLDDVDLGELL